MLNQCVQSKTAIYRSRIRTLKFDNDPKVSCVSSSFLTSLLKSFNLLCNVNFQSISFLVSALLWKKMASLEQFIAIVQSGNTTEFLEYRWAVMRNSGNQLELQIFPKEHLENPPIIHKIPVFTPSDPESPLRVCYPAKHAQGKAMYVIIVKDSLITSICLTAANMLSSLLAPA